MEKSNTTYIKIAVIGGILLFFGIIFIYNLLKLGMFKQDNQKDTVLNNTVVFEQPKLRIFDETRYINQFPDTIHIHYPYFIVVVPENTKQITTVYNLIEKKEVASYNDTVLDYDNGSFLYNYHGGNTYYNGKNLNVHCKQGFIKSNKEILCVVQNEDNPLFNDLISINPQSLSEKTLYSPQNAITAVYYNNNTLYVGEYNYTTSQPYISINYKKGEVKNYLDIIYPINNIMYAATFKNDNNKLTASYSEFLVSNNIVKLKLIKEGIINFY
jgi:hypothetical protein